jgi:hypothetical protein
MLKAARVQAIYVQAHAARGVVLPIVARTEEWSRGLLLALYFGVSELSACARRWSDDRAGIYGSLRVCV